MWFAIAFVVSLFVSIFLAPKVEVENARAQSLGENAFPKSKYGDVVPVVFGTAEVKAPFLTWYGQFNPVALTEEVQTGLFSSETVITGYRYLLGMDLLICVGPNIILKQIKSNKRLLFGGGVAEAGRGVSFENISIQNQPDMGGGLAYYPGNFDQQVDEYMNANTFDSGSYYDYGAGVQPCPSYAGFAHCVFVNFFIGESPTVPPFSFVVENFTTDVSAAHSIVGSDLNPMEIAYQILTKEWGHLNTDPAEIDLVSFQDAAAVLFSEGIGMSMVISAEIDSKKALEEVSRVADCVFYQEPSDGKVRVKLIRDDYVLGNLSILDESIIIDDPNLSKTTWDSTYNQVRVTYESRQFEYNTQTAIAQDFANIEYQGRVRSTTISMPGVKDDAVASKMAQRQLSFLSVPLFKAEFKANRAARNLRPGDVFILNWAPYGITNLVMRITKMDLGTLERGVVSINCVQDRFSTDLPTFLDGTDTSLDDVSIIPEEIVDFLIWEPPSFFITDSEVVTQSQLDELETRSLFMSQAKPPGSSSVSFDTHIGTSPSVPGVSLKEAPYRGRGLLEADYLSSVASDDGIDLSSSMIVKDLDLRTISSLVNNANLNDSRLGTSMFIIGDELFVYVGFTNLGLGRVQFTDVYRALLDTTFQDHFIDDEVWFINRDDNLLPTKVDIGTLTYFKLLDRSPLYTFDLASATAVSDTLVGRARRPLPPTFVTIDGSRTPPTKVGATSVLVEWKRRTRLDPKLYAYSEDYNSSFDAVGAISHRVTWTLNSDPPQDFTVNDSGSFINQYSIDTTGMVGTLVVEVEALDNGNSRFSRIADTIEVELT